MFQILSKYFQVCGSILPAYPVNFLLYSSDVMKVSFLNDISLSTSIPSVVNINQNTGQALIFFLLSLRFSFRMKSSSSVVHIVKPIFYQLEMLNHVLGKFGHIWFTITITITNLEVSDISTVAIFYDEKIGNFSLQDKFGQILWKLQY